MTTRILLVDDFAPWRLAVCSLLESATDLRVIGEACDGLEAIEKTERLRPDLVLLDVGIPTLNGIEAAKKIKEACPRCKVIFLTANDDDDVRNAALATGALAYLLKSRADRTLLSTLEMSLLHEVAAHEGGTRLLQ